MLAGLPLATVVVTFVADEDKGIDEQEGDRGCHCCCLILLPMKDTTTPQLD